jgi:uncharacterized membrane protein
VTLAELLAASAQAGTVEELLALDASAGDFLEIVASALSQRGDPAAVSVGALAAAASAGGTAHVGDWLHVATGGGEQALDAALNVFDLVRSSIIAANGQNALVIQPLAIAVPGVAQATLRVVAVEPAQIAIGPPGQDASGTWRTQVSSAQVRAELSLRALSALTLIGSAPVTLTVYSNTAESTARLRSIQCASADHPATRVAVDVEPGLWRFGIGAFSSISGSDATAPVQIAQLNLLGSCVARVTATDDRSLQSPAQTLLFDGPFVPRLEAPAPEHTQSVSVDMDTAVAAAFSGLGSQLDVDVSSCGGPSLPLGVTQALIENTAEGILVPLFAQIPALLTPALEVLGVETGGAELTVLSVHTKRPALVR